LKNLLPRLPARQGLRLIGANDQEQLGLAELGA